MTFYTIEAAGLRAHTTVSAAYGGSRGKDGLVGGSRAEADFIRAAIEQSRLV